RRFVLGDFVLERRELLLELRVRGLLENTLCHGFGSGVVRSDVSSGRARRGNSGDGGDAIRCGLGLRSRLRPVGAAEGQRREQGTRGNVGSVHGSWDYGAGVGSVTR